MLALTDGMNLTLKADPTRKVYLWYDLQDPNGLLFDDLAAVYPWGFRIFNRDFPKAGRAQSLFGEPLAAGMSLVIPSSAEAVEGVILSLRRSGIETRQVAKHRIARGEISFFLHFLQIISVSATSSIKGRAVTHD